MMHPRFQSLLKSPLDRKIVLLVADGLGGLPHPETGLTELETARIPNLDRLAAKGSGGRMLPISPGLTPGSGAAHLALFGYDPLEVDVGRGVLEALGSDFELKPGDLAARGNFATVDSDGIVRDRRAGVPPDEENRRLCAKLIEGLKGLFSDIEIHILSGKEHRFAVVFRGRDLDGALNDNDPQRENLPLVEIRPGRPEAARSQQVVQTFLDAAREVLADETTATGMLLRGFSNPPRITPFGDLFGVKAGAIAAYPMYRGVAQVVGMEILGVPKDFEAEVALLESRFEDYDFFFVHFKKTDSAGHKGDFGEKVRQIELLDSFIPRLEALGPEVLIITGDHSTPCIHKEHSWHPVPTVIRSSLAIGAEGARFTERSLMCGDLGIFHATDLMPLALAHASRLDKYGA
ncbi:MAG: 2,3-bisphosphoglycerate-independent phosphoglycerate mutase [Planctomycetes bacterium]|nr:2,3-bisphosphoglycerate-independent phosphoglycerate mutase [Planctomycetota bacterium]